MRSGRVLAAFLLIWACRFSAASEPVEGQWSPAKARRWYRDVAPLIGCNYLPRTAVNSTEMWQADTFDLETIDRELGWAGAVNAPVLKNYSLEGPIYLAELNAAALQSCRRGAIRYRPLPLYPEARRDLAIIVKEEITYERVLE